ncbi:protein translocase subunit SecD [Xanthobacter tagetidis]|jgi:preprotein translocase subunit SecD|uniref:Protein translocase subunit SecD n=1 Tax=Xanthobacter tagetidis TaxID=60216 RepID=A0A3L7AL01_9HYPH|nr:protein translocase subunit SecD [Xanthobacter tagetidis]MBB6309128.1 preprotein translocase subunit SecD [Xanthobacter tagetidis]RLP80390.1 protein translocase subunit SecD [Xanthobacter tagetidis]
MLHFSRFKIIAILVITGLGILFALPNVLPQRVLDHLPSWLASSHITLGLDLQGGSHILLEVDGPALIKERAEQVRDEVRRVLRDAKIGYSNLAVRDTTVSVRVRDPADTQKAVTELRKLAAPVTDSLFGNSTGEMDLTVASGADGAVSVTLTQTGLNARIRSAVDQSIEIIRRRIDQLGTVEPNIQRQGADRILVQVPGLQDPQRLKSLLGQTAKLSFRMVDMSMSPQQALEGRPPVDSEVLQGPNGEPYLVEKQVRVSGEDLVDAQPGFDQQSREPIVSFRFNSNGARRFAAVSQEAVGRPFAIVLDNHVISAPVIREPILGGSGQISGGFTVQQANDLAILLRAGALPAPLKVVEERTVGPSLGADSIESGKVAAYVASGLVAVFMVAVYGLFGVFALIALVVHITLMFSLQSILGATLTLPGIAGVILTIGMAVDSNVVIFERIRDEAREGRSAISAIDKGFVNALGTILDANITSLATAVILFLMGGSGPVRGFAVTYILGLLTTVFTAYTLTRLMIAYWVKWRRPAKLPI